MPLLFFLPMIIAAGLHACPAQPQSPRAKTTEEHYR